MPPYFYNVSREFLFYSTEHFIIKVNLIDGAQAATANLIGSLMNLVTVVYFNCDIGILMITVRLMTVKEEFN